MANIEHSQIADADLHEPKGVAGATLGHVYVADGLGGGAWSSVSSGTIVGFLDYNDAATAGTPITVPSNNTYVDLTNDEQGAFTNKTYPPVGVNDVWDAAANRFDWEDLLLGDMVDIRLDVEVTTTAANQTVDIALEMNTDGGSYEIPFEATQYKSAGSYVINRFNGVYMGDSGTLGGRAKFKIRSDNNATVIVRGWYCKVLINR